jgi:o-succinylbenzoate---CoA ligase
MAGKIITLGNTYSFENIKSGAWDPGEAPFIQEVLSFCQDWLTGEEEYLLKTSGSTGIPKSIQVSRSKMSKSAAMTGEFLQIGKKSSLLCCLNTSMIAGKMMLVRGMEWNAEVFIIPPSSHIPPQVEVKDYDLVAMVPLQMEKTLQKGSNNALLHDSKNFLIGGAPSSDQLRNKLRQWPGNFFQTFGMTETVSHIAMADLKTKGPLMYRTLPGVRIDTDAQGRLCIYSPTGINPIIFTNDIVEIIGENEFIWKGRMDFVINSGGYKILIEELEGEIEKIWHQISPLPRFFIDKSADNLLGERVVLVMESGVTQKQLQHLLALLKSNLHPYKYPKVVLHVDKFILTPSGKINRSKTTERLTL